MMAARTEERPMLNRKGILGGRAVAALILGLVSGPLLFWIVEPRILGEQPTPLFDRGTAIFFFFRLFPMLVVPAEVLIVAALNPSSIFQAFRLGSILAFATLVPLPVIDNWRATPSMYGYGALSPEIMQDVVVLAAYLSVLAAISASISALVSPILAHSFSRLWFATRKRQAKSD